MKEKYFKYSLVAFIIILGWLMISGLWDFVNGLLAAFTVYVIVRRQMIYLTEKRHINKIISAIILLLEVATCFVVPVFFIVWMLVDKVQQVNLDISQLVETVQHFITLIQEKTGYDILSVDNIGTATGYLSKGVQVVIGQISGLLVTTVVMLFLLYFMLISRKEIEKYVFDLLPFNEENKHAVMMEVHNMVRSNAIGIPLLAVIQGLIALLGYWVAGVPSAVLFGILTGFATIIPIVGTGIVWVPIVVYLALTGNWIAAIGLAVFCIVVVTNVDNVIRLILQKRLADTHPLITVFGVILGLKLFGFWGIIFGPLLMSMFFLLVNIFKKEYLDKEV